MCATGSDVVAVGAPAAAPVLFEKARDKVDFADCVQLAHRQAVHRIRWEQPAAGSSGGQERPVWLASAGAAGLLRLQLIRGV